MGGSFDDRGIMTTPILHYLTRSINTAGTPNAYGEPSNDGYYDKLATAFHAFVVSLIF
jgi:phosphoacetylglucosamine mutase